MFLGPLLVASGALDNRPNGTTPHSLDSHRVGARRRSSCTSPAPRRTSTRAPASDGRSGPSPGLPPPTTRVYSIHRTPNTTLRTFSRDFWIFFWEAGIPLSQSLDFHRDGWKGRRRGRRSGRGQRRPLRRITPVSRPRPLSNDTLILMWIASLPTSSLGDPNYIRMVAIATRRM